ncbi:MAG: hypothetical protein AAGA02_11020, partial [Bacteroidota bacterium]
MIKTLVQLLCFTLPMSFFRAQSPEPPEKVNIALILTDSYHQLGEATAADAQTALADYGIEARVNSYYHVDLDLITYEELRGNQLVFIDMINAAKVENVLPLLNRM